MPHPLVYEINARCWLRELSDRFGSRISLAGVPDSEFEKWREFGFTHIWLMGVWKTGPRSREVALVVSDWKSYADSFPDLKESDIVASPYAIAEYRVAEEFGGGAELKNFRERLARNGMKLILDFVPNHVGLDHRWLAERPDLFVRSADDFPGTFEQETGSGRLWIAHGKDPNSAPWADTAQLDYRNPKTRAAMLEQLLAISGQCDGVRCDMAMLVLNDVFAKTWERFPVENGIADDAPEFWAGAIVKTKQAWPDFLFLAEVYWGLEERLQSLGFDYTYDKALYDEIVRRNPAGVQRRLLGNKPEFVAASAHFLENHDEPRIASLLSFEEHCAAAFLILCLPGMRLLHHGQLAGARIKTPVQFGRTIPEATDSAIQKMYARLLDAIRDSGAGQGGFELLKPTEAWPGNPTAQNFILIQWRMESESNGFTFAAINLASHPGQCYAPLVLENPGESGWELRDFSSGDSRQIAGRELSGRGMFLDLPAHGTKLFQFSGLNP